MRRGLSVGPLGPGPGPVAGGDSLGETARVAIVAMLERTLAPHPDIFVFICFVSVFVWASA